MGRSKKYGRKVHGVLVLNKVQGLSSNQALQQAKRLFFANKAGHTGSLDPLATGVLPLCFGEATKFSQYVLDADKRYTSTFRLGQVTNTADSEGDIGECVDASHLTQSDIESTLDLFRGSIQQVPPMVSALKHQGQPLYKLARQGIEIPREARSITIHSLQLLAFRPGIVAEVDVDVLCTKGTYIRSIAHDLGAELGVGGHVSRLHRTQAGEYTEAMAVDLDTLTSERGGRDAEVLDRYLLPVDSSLVKLPKITLDDHTGHYFCQGQAIVDSEVYRLAPQGGTVRVCREDGVFLGLGEVTDNAGVAPRRVVVLDS